MRSNRGVSALHGVVFVLAMITGCGDGGSDGQTDLAKLPPLSKEVIDRAKAAPPLKSPPKFGAPPKKANS